MGFFNSIGGFLGGNDISKSIRGQQAYAMGPWNKAWNDLFGAGGEYEQSMGDYRKNYQELYSYFDTGMQDVESKLAERHAEEMGYLGTGKENVMQQVRQSYDAQQGQTLASNISSGLSGTSFGQGQLQSLAREESQQLGNVETAYAQQFAGTTARQGQEMQRMGQWRVGTGAQMRGNFAEGLEDLRLSWGSTRLGMERTGLSARQGWGQQHIGQTQQNVGMTQGMLGSVMGGFGF
tara:strand:+ start:2222 stop:2926 length:705 start_codon:yes stop_codon:yes gene_type:complete